MTWRADGPGAIDGHYDKISLHGGPSQHSQRLVTLCSPQPSATFVTNEAGPSHSRTHWIPAPSATPTVPRPTLDVGHCQRGSHSCTSETATLIAGLVKSDAMPKAQWWSRSRTYIYRGLHRPSFDGHRLLHRRRGNKCHEANKDTHNSNERPASSHRGRTRICGVENPTFRLCHSGRTHRLPSGAPSQAENLLDTAPVV